MGRAPCCEKETVKRGPWTPEEDAKLLACVSQFGTGSWRTLPKKAGLQRCGKSCRLRWTNYLRPDLKHGRFSEQEEQLIVKLHAALGSRWSLIAAQLPGRTDNDVKNYWNTRLKKKLCEMGIDPITHKPISQLLADLAGSMALPKGSSSSGGDIAEATLGCFKDDMLNVLLMRKRSEINQNGHHGHQSSATACPAAPPENPHAHLMNNIYNHNYSTSSNNHRLMTSSSTPPLPTMSFAPNHALIKPSASTNTTTNYSRRSLISGGGGGGLSSSVVNPCGPVSGIRSAQARSNNARSNGPANHSNSYGTSHTNNNYPPANYGANALSLLMERSANDVMMIVDDLKHLDYDPYNLSNDGMMQNLKALHPSPLLMAMNSCSSNNDGLNDDVVNGAVNADPPAEHAINNSGAFNDGDHSMDNDDDDDDNDGHGHGGDGDEEVPDLNLMNEGRISALHMEQQKHPNLYTLLMNQHMEAEMMQKKKKKKKKKKEEEEKEAEINMNSGDGNAVIMDQALQQNLGGNSNTGGVAQYANLIAHQDMMMMMMMAGHGNGHDPTAAQFHAENRPAHAPRVHHGLHNEGPVAFSAHDAAAPGPPNPAARCEWSPSSYTNSGSSSSNLSLCNNNDVVTHGLVLGDHDHVHIVDTGDIPSIDHQAGQQQTVVSPLDGLLWDLCELGSMVS